MLKTMFNLCVIACGLLIGCALLLWHAYTTDQHAADMKQVSDQLANIQWPIGSVSNRHHK